MALKIKDNIDLTRLKYFGFKLDVTRNYYEKCLDSFKIFIWLTKKDEYKMRHIYVESCYSEPMIFELDTIYDLIQAGLVERC